MDDSAERTNRFLLTFPNADVANTNQEAINLLSVNQYDLISLDHDLNGAVFALSSGNDSAMQTVKWICERKPPIKHVIIHSHNDVGAGFMRQALAKAGYMPEYHPFGPFYLTSLCSLEKNKQGNNTL